MEPYLRRGSSPGLGGGIVNFMEAMDAVEAGYLVTREAWGSSYVRVYRYWDSVRIVDFGEESDPYYVDLEDVFGEDWDLVVSRSTWNYENREGYQGAKTRPVCDKEDMER